MTEHFAADSKHVRCNEANRHHRRILPLSDTSMLSRMQFTGVWRDYQERVLAEMDTHLADQRLHIVAAPGSGKTVLGLEAMRRIGRPALILAPSLTVRDQWRDRLFPLFLEDRHGWDADISSDIEAPATMTVATYQALHAVYAAGAERFDAMVAKLAAKGPLTLIVDEAHHLRREWWTAMYALRDRLDGAILVALTATPPYDAPFAEWSRYEGLCGSIDAEISAPELVRNGELCPHQDHVHFSSPGFDEQVLLQARREAIEALVDKITADTALIDSIAAHPWLIEPETYEQELLDHPEYLTALMILLRTAGREIPRPAIRLLGVGDAQLPPLDAAWLERLFEGLLNEPRTKAQIGEARWAELRHAFDGLGLIENKRVTLDESKAVFTAVADSVAKLDSIVAIVRVESETMENALRLVILTDRVRTDELPQHPDSPFEPTKLGVVPIFEALRRAGLVDGALAVLTGTLVIIPSAVVAALDHEAARLRIDLSRMARRALTGCPGYIALETKGDQATHLVSLMTLLFERGAIRVLVGTQALLGEGWDAPPVNSLILASNAGSYMLSNQMRGRAIRIDPDAPTKVAAIWHLATVVPGTSQTDQGDLVALGRRFDAFEGIWNGEHLTIENGMSRLELDASASIEAQNASSVARASNRPWIADKWRASLGDATPRSHVRRIADMNYAPRQLVWADTLQALILSGISGGAVSAAQAIRQIPRVNSAATLVMLLFGATFLYSLPKLGRALFLWWRNGTLERSLEQVGHVLVVCLCHANALHANADQYAVIVRHSITGRCEVILDGATRAEERVFLDALGELLGPIQNPRYLLVRQSRLLRSARTDFHAVPACLGAHKDTAEYFMAQWRRYVGSSRLIYTRTGDGRRALLRARVQSFAAGMQRDFQRRSVWM